MATTDQRRSGTGLPASGRGVPGVVWVVAWAIGTGLLCTQLQTGPSRPETINPERAGTYLPGDPPRGVEPWLGAQYWPQIMQVGSLIAMLLFFAFAVRASRGQRLWHPLLVLGVAFVISTWMDPSANWVSYAAYNPELLHYRSTWWSDASPTVEPVLMAMSFPVVLSIPGLIAVAIYRRRLVPRGGAAGTWTVRHPLPTLLALSWAIGWLMDIAFELLAVRMQIWVYTQCPTWAVLFGGTPYQFPILGALLTSGMMAVSGPLLWRDDRGLTPANRLAYRLRLPRRLPNASAVVAACIVVAVSMGPFYAIFGAIRATHQARELARPWVFSELKVYDPHGDYQGSGEPGPYYPRPTTG